MGYCRTIAFLKNPVLLHCSDAPGLHPCSLRRMGVSSSPTAGVCEARPGLIPRAPLGLFPASVSLRGQEHPLAKAERLRNKSSLTAEEVPGHSLRKWQCLTWSRALPRSPHGPAHGHLSEPRNVWGGGGGRGAAVGRGCAPHPHGAPAVKSVAKHPRCCRGHHQEWGSLIQDAPTEGSLFPNVNPGALHPSGGPVFLVF